MLRWFVEIACFRFVAFEGDVLVIYCFVLCFGVCNEAKLCVDICKAMLFGFFSDLFMPLY